MWSAGTSAIEVDRLHDIYARSGDPCAASKRGNHIDQKGQTRQNYWLFDKKDDLCILKFNLVAYSN